MTEDPKKDEPIEAEFVSAEPAEIEAEATEVKSSSGPGWTSLAIVGLVAALGGGAIGVVSGGTGGRYAQASEVQLDISKLEDADRNLSGDVDELAEELSDLSARLSTASETYDGRIGGANTQIAELQTQLADLSASYDAMMGINAPASEDIGTEEAPSEEGDATEEDTPTKGEAPAILSLAALAERLDAIERVDTEGAATPTELARSVNSLQERTEALEAADLTLEELLSARADMIDTLRADLDTLEAGMTILRTDLDGAETREAFADLSARVEGLNSLVNEKLNDISVELNADEESLVRQADRVLALSTLESAIRSGEPFGDALESLSVQLPANSSISSLRRVADEGIVNMPELRSMLDTLKSDIVQMGMPEKRGGRWAWFDEALGSVMTVHEEGTILGETASEIIDDALRHIDAGNLPRAVEEVQSISGAQGELLSDWVTDAERHIQAEAQLERLRNDIVQVRTNR